MARFQILKPDWSIGATVTSNNEFTNMPSSRILGVETQLRWRTIDAVALIQSTIDTGSQKPWNAVLFAYTNAAASDTLRVTGGDATGTLFSSPPYDSTPLPFPLPGVGVTNSIHAFYERSPVSTRYIGLEIDATSNPDGYFEAGILVVGTLTTPPLDADLGSSRSYADTSVTTQLIDGSTVVRRRRRKRVFSINWQLQNDASSNNFDELAMIYGESTPFAILRRPEDGNLTQSSIAYGYAKRIDIVDQAPYGYSSVRMTITEA